MGTKSILSLSAIVMSGLLLCGGTAYAADTTPAPTPTTSTTGAAPTLPPGMTPVETKKAETVTLRSYVHPERYAFGFAMTGLLPTDQVTVTWSSVLNPGGSSSSNIYRGPDPAAGKGEWYSGRQPGWTTATVKVMRGNVEVGTLTLTNENKVIVTARRMDSSFLFRLTGFTANDRMQVTWVTRDGKTHTYDGRAQRTFTRSSIPGWKTATIRVYAAPARTDLLTQPLTIVRPTGGF